MVANRRVGALQVARLALVAAVLALLGCQTSPTPTPTPTRPAPTPPASQVAPDAAVRWQVDPAQTVVTVVVRRAGPLARFGHDHVITSADEVGSIWVGPTPAGSAFELVLPVERFEVDRPDARAVAGPEFAAPVPDDARAGTRQNMLRAEVLNAAEYPTITLRSTAASGDWTRPVIRLAVTFRGVTREQEIPVVIERSSTRFSARGELRLRQSDYGITPFSVAGGAIQVADTLEIRYQIVANSP